MVDAGVRVQLQALGAFIRTQRLQAQMSLRDLADLTNVSNPYLSQIERGLHEPSMRVLKSISEALNVSIDTLLARAGLITDSEADPNADPAAGLGAGPDRAAQVGERTASVDTAAAILADPALDEVQRRSLLAVYRSYVNAAR
jgi:transcriptional regulator with XRE-family HTH domain